MNEILPSYEKTLFSKRFQLMLLILDLSLNQNILLEAKLETLKQDSEKAILELQTEIDKLKKAKKPT